MSTWQPEGAGLSEAQVAAMAAKERENLAAYRERVNERAAKYQTASLADAIDQWHEWESTPVESAITTGWQQFDESMGRPMGTGEVIVIGARTGVGKSLIAQHFTLRKLATDEEACCVFLNMEMPNAQMAHRIVASLTNQSTTQASLASQEGMVEAGPEFTRRYAPWGDRLQFYPHPGAQVDDLAGVLEAVAAKLGIDPTLVVVDYAQLLGGPENTYERTSRNAKLLKQVAMEHNVAVLSCTQLSRGGRDGATRPSLSDLRDSGVLEEAADRILLWWRESDETEARPRVFGYVAKNRHGPTGRRVTLELQDSLRLREMPDEEVYAVQSEDRI